MMIMKTIAKCLILVLIFTSVTACSHANQQSTQSIPEDEFVQSTQQSTQSIPEDEFVQSTKETIPMSEWGLYNISDFSTDNSELILLDVSEEDLENNKIRYYGSGLLLKNGFVSTISGVTVNGSNIQYEQHRGPYKYTVEDNNSITFAGDGCLIIEDRIIINDVVVFDITDHFASTHRGYYVPLSMLI